MTKIIGLTGGIGSGKTTIANYFKAAGVPVYIADDAAREVMKTTEVQSEIKKVFGNSVFDGGNLDRMKIADIVFSNP
jgi:dephospho-CoA kinase